MPEHTSFFHYLIEMFPALGENLKNLYRALGKEPKTLGGQEVGLHSMEPLVASIFVALLIIVLAFLAKAKIADYKNSVIPDDKLTLRTFFELVIGMFYNMMKDMMGPKRAKRFFPIIGTCALFILFSNYLGMIPGILPPTSSLRITVGMGIIVFLSFNYYGIKENGLGYFTHLFGPWLGLPGIPINLLIFVVELFSLCMRPITLGMRLFMNIAVDHLLLTIFIGLVGALSGLFIPIPVMVLGTLVCIVQVIVFCLLSSIFLTLATEHEDHGAGHAPKAQHA